MAIYRQVRQSFWTDAKIVDDFTPEDRYFYLYLMTNPHTNLCGCYELSFKSASDETGYTKETIERLIDRLEKVHNVIRYSKETKEVLIVKWSGYNWTSSPKFRLPLQKDIDDVKNLDFKGYLEALFNGDDTVSIPYQYGSDTTVSVSVSNTVTETVSVNSNKDNTVDEILDLYTLYCPSLPGVRIVNDKRRKMIKTLLKTFSIEEIEEGFKKAEASDFCRGVNGGWKADFEFLINANNMAKVLEGKYDNRQKQTSRVEVVDSWV